MKKRDNKFTLVELLVVIGIASLLMGLVLPAFSRMVTGSAVDRLASNLKLRLERAQSHAASSRRHVALILPHGYSGSGEVWTGEALDAKFGGSRLCYVDWDSSNRVATFKGWVPGEKWEMPERGAYLIQTQFFNDTELNASANENFGKMGEAQDFGNKKSTETSNSGKQTIVCGTLDSPGAGGEYDGNKGLQVITGLHDDPDGSGPEVACVGSASNPPYNCAVVFSPQGTVCSGDLAKNLYIVVAEAMENDGRFIFPGGGAYNFRVLKVNSLTGAVRHFSR